MIRYLYLTYRQDPKGSTIPDRCGPGSKDNEEKLHILRGLRTVILPLDGFVSKPGHSLRRGVLPFGRDAFEVFYGPSGSLNFKMFTIIPSG